MSNCKLKTPAAAVYIGVSASWLNKSRLSGVEDAPPHYKFGRNVVYDESDLDDWLARHRVTEAV